MKNVTLQTDYKDPSSFTIAGKGVPVKDAREKVTGTLKFAVDMKIQGMVYGKILRSPHAHARITNNNDAARAMVCPFVSKPRRTIGESQGIWLRMMENVYQNMSYNVRRKFLE